MSRPSRQTTDAICCHTTHCDSTGPKRRPRKSHGLADGMSPGENAARPPVRQRHVQARRQSAQVRQRRARVRQSNAQVRAGCAAGSSSPPTSLMGNGRQRPLAGRHQLQRPGAVRVQHHRRCLSSIDPPRRLSAPPTGRRPNTDHVVPSTDHVAPRRCCLSAIGLLRCLSALLPQCTPRWRCQRRSRPATITPAATPLHHAARHRNARRRGSN